MSGTTLGPPDTPKVTKHEKGRKRICFRPAVSWSRGQDLNLRPSGYEPDELPDCSTPHCEVRSEERKIILLAQEELCKANFCKVIFLLIVFTSRYMTIEPMDAAWRFGAGSVPLLRRRANERMSRRPAPYDGRDSERTKGRPCLLPRLLILLARRVASCSLRRSRARSRLPQRSQAALPTMARVPSKDSAI